MQDHAVILLAAGSSSRMRGADKLMQLVDGVPLLLRQAEAALVLGGPVVVALSIKHPHRRTALEGHSVTLVDVEDADAGMGRSIAAAVASLPPNTTAAMIVPADMPEITADDLKLMATASEGEPDVIHRGASVDGSPGHPVVFPQSCFNALTGLDGDRGARDLLKGERVHLVPLPGAHALVDLDTPEEWAAWRAQRDR